MQVYVLTRSSGRCPMAPKLGHVFVVVVVLLFFHPPQKKVDLIAGCCANGIGFSRRTTVVHDDRLNEQETTVR